MIKSKHHCIHVSIHFKNTASSSRQHKVSQEEKRAQHFTRNHFLSSADLSGEEYDSKAEKL